MISPLCKGSAQAERRLSSGRWKRPIRCARAPLQKDRNQCTLTSHAHRQTRDSRLFFSASFSSSSRLLLCIITIRARSRNNAASAVYKHGPEPDRYTSACRHPFVIARPKRDVVHCPSEYTRRVATPSFPFSFSFSSPLPPSHRAS